MVLLVCFVAMADARRMALAVARMSSPVRIAAEAMPSRWAFEGLFLLEAAEHQAPVTCRESESVPDSRFGGKFFPGRVPSGWAWGRMRLALGSMLIGLAALAAFISGLSRPHP